MIDVFLEIRPYRQNNRRKRKERTKKSTLSEAYFYIARGIVRNNEQYNERYERNSRKHNTHNGKRRYFFVGEFVIRVRKFKHLFTRIGFILHRILRNICRLPP